MFKITIQNLLIFDKVLKYKNSLYYHTLLAIGYLFLIITLSSYQFGLILFFFTAITEGHRGPQRISL